MPATFLQTTNWFLRISQNRTSSLKMTPGGFEVEIFGSKHANGSARFASRKNWHQIFIVRIRMKTPNGSRFASKDVSRRHTEKPRSPDVDTSSWDKIRRRNHLWYRLVPRSADGDTSSRDNIRCRNHLWHHLLCGRRYVVLAQFSASTVPVHGVCYLS